MRHPILQKRIKPSRIGLINLGCARNLVDSQAILGHLQSKGHTVVDIAQADIVIVNTCAFIDEAKNETIDTLLDLIELKKEGKIKKIFAAGCFTERYAKEFPKEFKEVDLVAGVLPLEKKKVRLRLGLTPRSYAYLKICESCYNHCSFCVIPKIKGKFVSRYQESILEEVRELDRKGIKEINVIGQDITAYGLDIYRQKSLAALVREICATTKKIKWIRLLYLFPAHITEELLDTIAQEEKVCKYLDLPLQHVNHRILKSMNRPFYKNDIAALIRKIRKKIPGVCLRTAFIVGYPGETEKEFKELYNFIKRTEFEHIGVFTYSQEEETKAAQSKNQVPDTIKQRRREAVMQLQQKISEKKLKRLIGCKVDVLIDTKEKSEKNLYLGRTQYDAPEVDGLVFVKSTKQLKSGDLVRTKIIDSYEHDLLARI